MNCAIIGGGVIGAGWAARLVLNGHDVTIYDPQPDIARSVGEVLAKLGCPPAETDERGLNEWVAPQKQD